MFVDFDGTLVDLAERPETVVVPAELVPMLSALSAKLGGAVAVVSGRTIAQLDEFLAPLRLPASGVHGAERRRADGSWVNLRVPDLSHVIPSLQLLAARHQGLLVESKPGAVALHYRQAPQCETVARQAMEEALARTTGMALMHGKMVIELKLAETSKGRAIEAFMAEQPFAGRRPLFAGDDVTDESGFAFVQSCGGAGIKVGPGPTGAQHRIDNPTALRAWLEAGLIADTAAWRPA